MPRYDPLTHRLARYLLGDEKRGRPRLIDPYEHGRLVPVHGEPTPIPVNKAWKLADKRAGHPERISRTHLARHLSRAETFYYRSHRGGGHALLMIDVDAHEGQRDALEVAEAIEHFYLNGCYHEPSTNGRGRHVYAVVAFNEYAPRRRVNRWLTCVGLALRGLMLAQGYAATVDPGSCRTFSEYGRDAYGQRVAVRMGQLAKLPRPMTAEAMDRLERAPVYLPAALHAIVEDYKRWRARTTGRPAPVHPVPAATAGRTGPPPRTALPGGAFNGMNADDPRSRAVHAVMHLARQLGRLPQVAEARAFYEGHGLATTREGGDRPRDVARRERRLAAAIDHVAKTFDEARATGGFHLEALLPLVRRHVRPEHRAGTKYRYAIADEDLAVALHVVERASFERRASRDHQWTCGVDRILGTFRALKASGATRAGCNREKAVALKVILQRAGLAEVIDASYRPGLRGRRRAEDGEVSISNTCVPARTDGAGWGRVGYDGRSKRVVVGPAHPRRGEWERERAALWQWAMGGGTNLPLEDAAPQPVNGGAAEPNDPLA